MEDLAYIVAAIGVLLFMIGMAWLLAADYGLFSPEFVMILGCIFIVLAICIGEIG